MATERQIEANKRNSARSTGPRSEFGKRRSAVNSTKHGMAGQSAEVEASISDAFADRRARWAAEQNPVGEAAEWALDRAVAATFRIERCEHALDDLTADVQQRAALAWDEDRAVEAATILGRIGKDPVLASRRLQTTLAGVGLLIEAWLGLLAALATGRDWSEPEASRALDLLGVAPDLRSGLTLIDDPEGPDPLAFRRAMASEEIERLEALRDEALTPLEELARRQAMAGDIALLSKRAQLILRYEREAWKRFNDSMKELKASAAPVAPPVPVAVAPAPPPAVAPPPRPATPAAAPSRSFEEERRALLAQAAPYRAEAIDRLVAMGIDDEDQWLDALERRIEAAYPLPGSFVPIAASRG